MKILLVSQYFWPETFIISELTKCIVAKGHTIEVLTGKPNYPDGTIYKGYSAYGCTTDFFEDNILVHRVPLYPRGKGGGKRLFINYLSFVLSGLFYFRRLVKTKQFDIIFVFALSPITSVIPAIYLKRRLKLPLAVWVQDLWPESVEATGFIRNRFLLNCVKILVKGIYYFSDTLLVQSRAFIPQISNLAPKKEIIYYPNSAKDDLCQPDQAVNLPDDLKQLLMSHFCVVFAGNIGTAQAVETIVTAAKQLKEIVNLKLVLVGSGSQVDWVKEKVSENKLSNLVLPGRFPASEMPYIFSKASALLVTLKSDRIFTYTIPCKIQAYLAAGKPIIAAVDGEGAMVITEAGAGFTSPSEDAEALAKNIKKMYYLPVSNRDEMGKSGRAYFLEHFEMKSQSQRLIDILGERINKRKHFK